MSNLESKYKTALIKQVNLQGGYGRRIEDQFAVGILDMVVVFAGMPVFLAEGKVVRGKFFEPSTRQYIEMERIDSAGGSARALLIGFHENGDVSFSPRNKRAMLNDPLVRTYPKTTPVRDMFEDYWRFIDG